MSATPTLSRSSHKLSPQAKALYLALLARMVKANHALRTAVRRQEDGGCNVAALLMDPWEDLLVPLQWEDVEAVWGLMAGADTSDAWLLRHLVEEITDSHMLVLRGTFMGLETLWPVTAVQVVASEEERVSWVEEVYPKLKELLSLLPGHLNKGVPED